MTTCAVVQISDSTVINIVIAEVTDLPPKGCQLFEILPEISCEIGTTWDGTITTLPVVSNTSGSEDTQWLITQNSEPPL